MKKMVSLLAVMGLLAQSGSMYAEDVFETFTKAAAKKAGKTFVERHYGPRVPEDPTVTLEKDVELMQEKVPFYRLPEFKRGLAESVGIGVGGQVLARPVAGAVKGGAVGTLSALHPLLVEHQEIEEGTKKVRIATAGAAIVWTPLRMAFAYGMRWWQVKRINNILQKYTSYNFYTLPLPGAMLVLAAYRKDINAMRTLARKTTTFINKPGVWQALAHLYQGPERSPEGALFFKDFVLGK